MITSFGPRSPTWRLLISVPELICVFENLGLAFLSGDQFPVEGFLSWLDEHVSHALFASYGKSSCSINRSPTIVQASRAVQDRIIFQKRLLSQLNMERLFRSLCTTPRYRRSINSYVREVDVTADLRVSRYSTKLRYSNSNHFLPLGSQTFAVGPSESSSLVPLGRFTQIG